MFPCEQKTTSLSGLEMVTLGTRFCWMGLEGANLALYWTFLVLATRQDWRLNDGPLLILRLETASMNSERSFIQTSVVDLFKLFWNLTERCKKMPRNSPVNTAHARPPSTQWMCPLDQSPISGKIGKDSSVSGFFCHYFLLRDRLFLHIHIDSACDYFSS
ncbi:hypothetical protein CDAR_542101 [Caerostris darwini]|uniref:Uncharacterized protein n=1 Tax=Caerostris darwini TaxID=1538125 RepID=A0AAV4W3C7_9ARAC|nr:hypothetical protein CDAR_542101 [Caerostris darwini]